MIDADYTMCWGSDNSDVMLLRSGLMVALALVGARGLRRRPTYNRMSEMSKSI
ncbi:hypothetical protein [Rhodococcus qingshengii]